MKKLFIAIAVIGLLSCCSNVDRENDKSLWFSHGKHDGKTSLEETDSVKTFFEKNRFKTKELVIAIILKNDRYKKS